MPTNIAKNYKFDLSSSLEDKSFALLRTNPRLAGNNKIVVASDGAIFLETIDANTELSNSKYKKYRLAKDGNYSYDLATFYNDNATPYDLIYDVKRDVPNDLTVFNDYQFQFEDSYKAGATISYSKLYDEKFKIFAPIWLEKRVPSKFVIYRVSGTTTESTNMADKVKNMIKNSEIVKVFDLSKSSELGAYLRNHVENQNFPTNAITANFGKNDNFIYHGIDLKAGGFVSKPDYVFDDIVGFDNALIAVNEYITDGFKRNAIVSANLINLEFQFDDPSVESYDINRYFGLFVDEIEDGKLLAKKLVNSILHVKQHQSAYDLTDFAFLSPEDFSLPRPNDFAGTALGYVKSKNNYHNIKNAIEWEVGKIPLGNLSQVTFEDFDGFELQNFTLSAEEFKGSDFDRVRFKISGTVANGDKLAITRLEQQVWKFKLTSLLPSESVTITISDGVSTDTLTFATTNDFSTTLNAFKAEWEAQVSTIFNNYEVTVEGDTLIAIEKFNTLNINDVSYTATVSKFKISAGADHVDLNGYTISADSSLIKGSFSDNKFSSNGSNEDVAYAIESCLKKYSRDFKVSRDGDTITVTSNVSRFRYPNLALLEFATNSMDLEIIDGYSDAANYLQIYVSGVNVYGLTGGHAPGKAFLIKTEDFEAGKIEIGDFIGLQSVRDYAKILDIVKYDATWHKVIVDAKKPLAIRKSANVYRTFYPTVGKFDIYDIKDFDFDFYSTKYSEPRELILEQNTYMNPVTNPLNVNAFSDGYSVGPYDYFSFLLPSLQAEDSDISTTVDPLTEYDRLQENYNKKYFNRSRTVPCINKFGLKDATNVRDTEYSLNISEAFGKTNFAADIDVEGRSALNMTHEWFYLDNFPKYEKSNGFNFVEPEDFFSYLNFDIDANSIIELNDFYDVTENVYDKYFVYDGFGYDIDLSTPQDLKYFDAPLTRKYSLFDEGNTNAFSKTKFRGLEFTIKERKETTTSIPSEFKFSNKYNSYKFSSVLLTDIDPNDQNLVSAKSIVNEKFKTVTLVLQMSLQESLVDYVNRKVLYELRGRYNSAVGIDIANTNITGYLNLLSFNSTTLTLTGTNTQFTTQITLNSAGSYNRIRVIMPSGSGLPDMCVNVKNVINDTTLVLNSIPTEYDATSASPCTATVYNFASLTQSLIQNADYIYINGGETAHEEILSFLSAKNIADKLNSNSSLDIEYITVKEDGTISYNDYILNVDDGTDVYKPTIIDAIEDPLIPNSYKGNTSAVGYNLGNRLKPYVTAMKRLNGKYNPVFSTVVTFYNPSNKYKTFLDNDIDLGSEVLTGTIEEFAYDSANNTWYVNGDSTLYVDEITYNKESFEKMVVTMPAGSLLQDLWFEVKKVVNSTELIIKSAPKVYDSINGVFTSQLADLSGYNISEMGSFSYFTATDLDTADYHYMIFDRDIARSLVFNQKYFRKGIEFMTSTKNFGTVKNLFYHKVNEINVNSVTKLAQTGAFQPVYPLIGEVAIDKRDINIFTSQFEKGYYVRSLSNSLIEEVYGTKSPVVKKSFLASSLMQPSSTLYLTKFTSSVTTSLDQLNKLRDTQTNTTQSVLFETTDQIFIDFYNEKVLIDELLENGLLQSMKKFVIAAQGFGDLSTVEDDAREYAASNLLPLYNIESVSIYVKQIKNPSDVASANSIEEVLASNYLQDNNFTFQLHANKPFNMRLIYNKRPGYTYSVLPVIKISI